MLGLISNVWMFSSFRALIAYQDKDGPSASSTERTEALGRHFSSCSLLVLSP